MDPLGNFNYTYVGATRRLSTMSFPNGQTTTYAYFDNLGDHRLQEIKHQDASSAIISRFNYTYDKTGNVITWTQQSGAGPARVYTLGYDAAGQLGTAVISGVSPLPIPSRFAYGYDKAGNRTAEQLDDAVTGGTYNNLDQLVSTQPGGALLFRGTLSEAGTVTVAGKAADVATDNSFRAMATVPSGTSTVAVVATDPSANVRTNIYQLSQTGASRTLIYDLNGNLTNDGTRTFEWDAENRLLAVNQGVLRSEFIYNGLGQRVRIVERDNGAVTSDKRFVWCDVKPCQERDASGSTVTKAFYRHGLLDGGVKNFTTVDHLGSIREITDNAVVLKARYEYDPFGRMTKVSGTYDTTFGFTGHYVHGPTGHFMPLYRAYAPELGLWTSEDPRGLIDGPSRYRYVRNNPVVFTDPTGELTQAGCVGWFMLGVGLLGGGLGAAGGTVVTVGTAGLAFPAIPGGAAGGFAGGAALGGAIGLIVCGPPPPLCLPRSKPPDGPLQKCYKDCELEYSDPVDIARCKLLCDMMYGPVIH